MPKIMHPPENGAESCSLIEEALYNPENNQERNLQLQTNYTIEWENRQERVVKKDLQ